MNTTFENHKNGNGGFISLKNETEEIGRATYTISPENNLLIISYVMVYPKFGGQGFGKKLVFLCTFCNDENARHRRCLFKIKKVAKFATF